MIKSEALFTTKLGKRIRKFLFQTPSFFYNVWFNNGDGQWGPAIDRNKENCEWINGEFALMEATLI